VRGVLRRLGAFLRGDDLRPDQRDGGREIRLVGLIVVAGMASASVFQAIYGLVVKWHYPYNTFLYNPHQRFSDFFDVWNVVVHYGSSNRYSVTAYSPFIHLVFTLLANFPDVIVFAAMYLGFWITLAAVLWRGATRRIGSRRLRWIYVAIFTFISYPVLFALDRGNIEVAMFILLAVFVYLYYERQSSWAWLPLGLAVASKYWYAVFLVAMMWDRRWRQLIYCTVGALAANLGGALVLARLSGFTFAQVSENAAASLGGFVEIRGDFLSLVQHGHTVWGVLQVFDMWLGWPLVGSPHAAALYVLLALAVFSFVAVRLDKACRPPWLGFTALLVCGMLFPYQSHDYTGIHLFLPLALLGAHGVQVKRGTLVAVLFGLMLVPMSYGVIVMDTTVSVLIYPVVLATLLVTVVRVAPARGVSACDDASETGRSLRLELPPTLAEAEGPATLGAPRDDTNF
jgi:Glycosyltransferase family 87